jgi:hypothetical protein
MSQLDFYIVIYWSFHYTIILIGPVCPKSWVFVVFVKCSDCLGS